MKIYLAGPMRGYPRLNFDAFDEVAAMLREMGHSVINPAEIDRKIGLDPENYSDAPIGSQDPRAAILRDVNVILYDAEAIVMLPGWERSRGVAVERATADYIGIPALTLREFMEGHMESVAQAIFTSDPRTECIDRNCGECS